MVGQSWSRDIVYDFEQGTDKFDLGAPGTSFAALSVSAANGSAADFLF